MSGRWILVGALLLVLILVAIRLPGLLRRFTRNAVSRGKLTGGSANGILAEVDARITELESQIKTMTSAEATAFGPEALQGTRRELRELQDYRERLIREARQRGLDIGD